MTASWIAALCLVWTAAEKPSETPWAARPYRVQVWWRFDPTPRVPVAIRRAAQRRFVSMADVFLGGAWDIRLAPPPESLLPGQTPAEEQLKGLAADFDKLLWIHVDPAPPTAEPGAPAVTAHVREYDFHFGQWGPAAVERVAIGESLPREIFEAALRQFRPVAVVNKTLDSGEVEVVVRGLALRSERNPAPLVRPGTPFRLFREFIKRGEEPIRTDVPWTYLLFQKPGSDRMTARCKLISLLNNPLSSRTRGRTRVLALGVAGRRSSPTTVRFVTGEESEPVVGFEVVARPSNRLVTFPVGETDHRGAVEVRPIEPGRRPDRAGGSLVEVTLLDGSEPIARFPLLPGDRDETTVRVRFDPLLNHVHGRILALQEEVVDTVARWEILQKRLNLYSKRNDIEKARDVAKQMNALPGKSYFLDRLARIKANTEERQKIEKRPRLGSGFNRLFMQTEELLNNFVRWEKVTIELTETKAEADGS